MSDQYYSDSNKPAVSVERVEPDPNSPVRNLDPLADKAPADAAGMHEAPMGGAMVYETPKMKTNPSIDPMDETLTHQAPAHQDTGSMTALIPHGEAEHFRTRWNEIQGKFVDDPRVAVQQADTLVSEVIDQITRVFADEHHSLEGKWNQGNNVSTEDLRLALQHYRTFFNRLVV